MKKNDHRFADLLNIIQFTEQVCTRLYASSDEKSVYSTVIDAFKDQTDHVVTLFELTDNNTRLFTIATTMASQVIETAEKATGFSIKNFKINLDKSPYYRRAAFDGQTVLADGQTLLSEILPAGLTQIAGRATGFASKKMVITPFYVKGQISGVLSISAPHEAEYFIPTAKNLAYHISAALELAVESNRRNALEKRLLESEQRFRELIENTDDISYFADLAGELIYISPQVNRYGFSHDQMINHSMLDFIHPEDRDMVNLYFKKSLKERIDIPTEFRVIANEGELFWFEDRSRARTAADGTVIGVSGILRDITARKKTEQELQETNKKLARAVAHAEIFARDAKEANEAKSRFLANMSHEIRTPLNGIVGVADLMRNTLLSKEQQEYLDIIHHSSKSLVDLIDEILDFSKIEAGKIKLADVVFSLDEVLDEVADILAKPVLDKRLEFY
ncbi:MAG: PAS domain S-box protein, partial [Chitinivibrionales bacterium]|nr:PAS domain S-box protein [Chitinivibrionales bacterium]